MIVGEYKAVMCIRESGEYSFNEDRNYVECYNRGMQRLSDRVVCLDKFYKRTRNEVKRINTKKR